jgi:D-alanyl-lipoteichoic acid acyltransferase DltB (MBOAT superfamily)
MFFNSLEYLLFLPVVAVVMYLLPGRYRWLWLLITSIVFYLLLLPEYLIVFFALICLNYLLAIIIEKSVRKRNLYFVTGICLNVLVLAFFKYIGFLQALFTDIKGLSADDHLLRIILPVGLSFFIFTSLSYLIEVKRGTIHAERNIGIFASSLLFFPKIMQGPIEKPGNIFPQFREAKSFSYEMAADGLKLMLWGYFKKLVVADRIALYVNAVYGNYEHHSGLSLLAATLLYSFQIYADFSGYTDIALGSARILGINLTNNFNRPYFATSIREFWNRWHISLSVWLRDYLFLPIAVILANHVKRAKFYGLSIEKWIFMVATMITFAICGLWHGEGVNFLVWGLLFGVYLTVANWSLGFNKKLLKLLRIKRNSMFYRLYGIAVTFILVSFTWIFFRAADFQAAIRIVNSIFRFSGTLFIDKPTIVFSLIGIFILVSVEIRREFGKPGYLPFRTNHWLAEHLAYASLVIVILLIGVFDGGQFIYFQF